MKTEPNQINNSAKDVKQKRQNAKRVARAASHIFKAAGRQDFFLLWVLGLMKPLEL